MRYTTLIPTLSLCLLTWMQAQAQTGNSTEPTQVMLQGSSAPEIRQLVERNGGTITHDLHIINAVGALLTRAQLDAVLKSPLVSRHIDDLSVSELPEEKPEKNAKNCDVTGHLELTFSSSAIRWKLYNKRPEPAKLEKLELSWPASMGVVQRISLGSSPIDSASFNKSQPGSLSLQFDRSKAPVLEDIADLEIDFSPPKASSPKQPLRQRDFNINAGFFGDCSTKLIPGYDDNHENFYYSMAAGVNALHQNGITGRGVTVAVLDSGLWEHELILKDTSGRNRIVAKYDAITNTSGEEVFDESGHGTHMVSVIAHSGAVYLNGSPTGTYQGISPDVSLVAVKALDVDGQGHLLDLIRGIQWIVDNRQVYEIRVLNLSFAQRPRWHYWEDPVNQAVMQAWGNGITVVVAAGNEGPDPMSIGSPGNLPYVITVGAVTDSWTPNIRDDDYIPDFSSRGPTPSGHIKPDIVAPGGHITGIIRPGSALTREHPEDILSTGEFVSTGSSQASAVVSGIVAILLQLEPDLSPDDIKCKLISSAEPAINQDGLLSYSPFQQGHGYVSATRAVTLGQNGCGNPDMDVRAELRGSDHFEGPAIMDDEGNISLPGLKNMVSEKSSEKGLSKSRRWGVKAHIERAISNKEIPVDTTLPFDWQELYLLEKAAIENLTRDNPQ